jgi:hypothetical protein
MPRKAPDIIEVSSQQMQELLDRAASNTLRDEDTELIRQIFDSYVHVFQIVGDKNTTIARLRKLLFGASTEKADQVMGKEDGEQDPSTPDSPTADSSDLSEPNDDATDKEPSPGHGRYGADDYPGAHQVDVKHETLCVGDDCPDCQAGTLYEKTPGVFVRFAGQAPLQATVYRLQRLRCHLCGKVFTASSPEDNLCERALKKAILHRKNSLFYKTRNGARVGDIYMSLIYTCELNGVNAFDYLNQLQLHASEVAEHPECWMPWNYQDALTARCSAHNAQKSS